MKKLLPVLFALALLFLIGCSKEGPAGPAGASGANNVTSFDTTVSSWTLASSSYYANISVPSITQNLMDSGAVIVYRVGTNTSNQTFEEAMPYTDITGATFIDYVQLGEVQIDISNHTGTPPAIQFKVVVIQGK